MPPRLADSSALRSKFKGETPFFSPQHRTKEEAIKAKVETQLTNRPSRDEQKLNKLETSWLEVLRGRPHDWLGIQPLGLKLADNCRYHPDFVTLYQGQLTAWETKGFMRDDAQVKLKTAARLFPFIRFVLVTRTKGEWTEKEVPP